MKAPVPAFQPHDRVRRVPRHRDKRMAHAAGAGTVCFTTFMRFGEMSASRRWALVEWDSGGVSWINTAKLEDATEELP